MKKLSVLLVVIFSLCTLTLHAQEAVEAEIEEEGETSYGIIGLKYNMGYFGTAPTRLFSGAEANLGITAKIPFSSGFGIELGLAGLTLPVSMIAPLMIYTSPTNVGTNTGLIKGTMNFTEIDFNVIYYCWFLKTLQIKLGLGYLDFTDQDLSLEGVAVGWDEDHYLPDNNFVFNLGISIDLPLFEQFYLMSGVGFKMFFDTTFGSVIGIDLGLGYQF